MPVSNSIEMQSPEKPKKTKLTKMEKEMMYNLPRIETKMRRDNQKDYLNSRKESMSPLAAELNFIYRNSKKGSQSKRLQKYSIKPSAES